MSRLEFILILVLIIISAFLRTYNISANPVSLYWDEVSLGYNAFSISETLRDEYGNFMPLLFEAFNDYKMPAYIYLTAVMVKLFGLNEFAVRIGSALLGTMTVVVTYFFVKELFYGLRVNGTQFSHLRVKAISFISMLLLAISPWHLQFSRTGYEAIGGLFFVLFGSWLFLRGIHYSPNNFIGTACFWGIAFYFYRSIIVFLPILIIILLIIYYKELRSKIKHKVVLTGICIFIIFAVPIYHQVFFTKGSIRADQVLLVKNMSEKVALFQMWAIQSGNGYLGNIFYNKRIVYANEMITNYISHFDLSYLFILGDGDPRHSPRNMGMMYLFELPLFIYGLYKLVRSSGKIKYVLFMWLLAAPIPAAVSIDAPHALRSLNMLPIIQIICAFGAVSFFFSIHPRKRYFISTIYSIFAVGMISGYLFNYHTTTKFLSASAWGDGYKQLNLYLNDHKENYDKIIISGQYWQPYIYTLFYTKYDPAEYQKNGSSGKFDKYIFGATSWGLGNQNKLVESIPALISGNKRTLIALSPKEYESQINPPKILTKIKDINNKDIFIIEEL